MDFREQLIQVSRVDDLSDHPLVRALSQPEVPAPLLKHFGLQMYHGADIFVVKLTKILSITPEWRIRTVILENLIEEEGLFLRGHHLEGQSSRRHVTWARDLAVAMGASEEELNRRHHTLPKWFAELINQGEWLGAVSYLLVGQEANFPRTIESLLPPLRKLGYSNQDLRFLTLHHELDSEHATAGIDLVCEWARTKEAQREALASAERGAKEWWTGLATLARSARPVPAGAQ